jgi:hypothetical protein
MQKTRPTIRFTAELDEEGLSLPNSGSADFQGPAMIEGTLNGFPFRALLEPSGNGIGILKLTKSIQVATGVNPGDSAVVEITRVDDEPELRVPADFREALAAAPKARSLFEEVTPNARREWVRWIISGKQEETRIKRIAVGIDKLSKGMRRPCCFPGLNFVTKGLVEPEETWAPLPSLKK